jgi:Mg2+-importing ATPase
MVNLAVTNIMLGNEIEKMSEEELNTAVEHASVFAKLSPIHKERIIKALQFNGHVVGFLGDGINDTPALKAADVGISVDTAADIAKESSDIILLENNLLVLEEGIIEGRRVFGNIIKYIKMTASSNFGNIFSVLAASIFIPFLPMLSIQILTNNLLYDVSQLSIPYDRVDEEWLAYPRKWQVSEIKKYIFFMGPISSIFDCITFAVLLFVFDAWSNPAFFQTGWFLESLLTQTLVIHIIRTNNSPFVSRASIYLYMTTVLVVLIGVLMVNTDVGSVFGFQKLPLGYYSYLVIIVVAYLMSAQFVKSWLVRTFHII